MAKTWDGSTNSNWNVADNWTPSGIPPNGEDVELNGTTSNVDCTIPDGYTGARAEDFTIQSNYTGTFTINEGEVTQYGGGLRIERDLTLNGHDVEGTDGGVCFRRASAGTNTHSVDGSTFHGRLAVRCGNGEYNVFNGDFTVKGEFYIDKGAANACGIDFETHDVKATFEGDLTWQEDPWYGTNSQINRVEFTWSSQTELTFSGTKATQIVDWEPDDPSTGTVNDWQYGMPATVINKSSGKVQLRNVGATDGLLISSLTLTDGELDINGNTVFLGASTFAAGTKISDSAGGGVIAFLDSAEFNGSSGNNVEIDCDLNFLYATTVTADYCTVTNCNVGGGVLQIDNGTDGGGNENVSINTKYRFETVTGTTPADSTDKDYTYSGFGTPDAAIVIISGADSSNNPRDDGIISIGFMDGTDDISWGVGTEDGITTTNSGRRHDSAGIGRVFYGESGGGGSGSTTLADWDATFITDGIRLSIDNDATTTEFRVHVWLMKGVKNAKALFTKDQTINFGFRPSLVFAGTIGQGVSVGNTVHGYMSFGAIHIDSSDTVTQGCVAWGDASRQTTGRTFCDSSNSEFAVYGGPYGNIWTANCTGLNGSVGITVNNYDSDDRILYLALELEDHDDAELGWFDSATTVDTTTTVSSLGIRPATVMCISTMNDALNDLETTEDMAVAVGFHAGGQGVSAYHAVEDAFAGNNSICGYSTVGWYWADAAASGWRDIGYVLHDFKSDGFAMLFTEVESTAFKNFFVAINDGGVDAVGFTGTGTAGTGAGAGQTGTGSFTSPDFIGTGTAGTSAGTGQVGTFVGPADQLVFPTASNSGNEWDTLAQAITAASDGDIIEISGSWSSADSSSTQINLSGKDLTIRAVGTAKWSPTSTNNYRLEYTGSGTGRALNIQSMGANDEMTIEGIEIIHDATGTSSEAVRWECYQGETLNMKGCYLHTTQSTSDSDLFYINGGASNAPNGTINIEQCVFYNAYRTGIQHQMFAAQSASTTLTVNINSCLFYKCGINDYQAGAIVVAYGSAGSGGDNYYSNWNIQNCLVHSQEKAIVAFSNGNNARASGTDRGRTQHNIRVGNCLVYDQHDFGGTFVDTGDGTDIDTFTNNQKDVTFRDTTPVGTGYEAYFESLSGTLDFRLKDHADNDAIDYHNDAEIFGLTIPSEDIIGTSRPQDTNYDVGPFEVVTATNFDQAGAAGTSAGTGRAGSLVTDYDDSGAAGTSSGTGQAGTIAADFTPPLPQKFGSFDLAPPAGTLVADWIGTVGDAWGNILLPHGTVAADFIGAGLAGTASGSGRVGTLTTTIVIDWTGAGVAGTAAGLGRAGSLLTDYVDAGAAGTSSGLGRGGSLAFGLDTTGQEGTGAGAGQQGTVAAGFVPDDALEGEGALLGELGDYIIADYLDTGAQGTAAGSGQIGVFGSSFTGTGVAGTVAGVGRQGSVLADAILIGLAGTAAGAGRQGTLATSTIIDFSQAGQAGTGAIGGQAGTQAADFIGLGANGAGAIQGQIGTLDNSVVIDFSGAGAEGTAAGTGIAGLFANDYQSLVLLHQPVHYWPMNNNQKGSADNVLHMRFDNNLNDETGRHSPIQNGVTFNSTTKRWGSHAGEFNGSGYASVLNDDDWDFQGDYTIECWLYLDTLPAPGYYATIAAWHRGDSNLGWRWLVDQNGRLHFACDAGGTNGYYSASDRTITTGQWYHLATVGVNGRSQAFVNGVFFADDASHSWAIPGTPLYIGTTDGTNWKLDGKMDELRFTDRARYDGTGKTIGEQIFLPPGAQFGGLDDLAGDLPLDKANSPTVVGGLHKGADTTDGALDFNGTSQYAIGNTADFRQSDDVGTIEAWIRTGTPSSPHCIFASCNADDTNKQFAFEVDTSGYLTMTWFDFEVDTTFDQVRSTNTVDDDKAHHVVVTTDGADYKLFIDGVEETLVVTNGSNDGRWFADFINAARDNVTIGSRVRTSTIHYFDGVVDQVAVYDRVLTQAEITAHYRWAPIHFDEAGTAGTGAIIGHPGILQTNDSIPFQDQGLAGTSAGTGQVGTLLTDQIDTGDQGTGAGAGQNGTIAAGWTGENVSGTATAAGQVGELLTDYIDTGIAGTAAGQGRSGTLSTSTTVNFSEAGLAGTGAIAGQPGTVVADYLADAQQGLGAGTGQIGTIGRGWTGEIVSGTGAGTGQLGDVAADFIGDSQAGTGAVQGYAGTLTTSSTVNFAEAGQAGTAVGTGHGGSIAWGLDTTGQASTGAATGQDGTLLTDFTAIAEAGTATAVGQVGTLGVGTSFADEGVAGTAAGTGQAGSIVLGFDAAGQAGTGAIDRNAGSIAYGFSVTGQANVAEGSGEVGEVQLGASFDREGVNGTSAGQGQQGAVILDFVAFAQAQAGALQGQVGTSTADSDIDLEGQPGTGTGLGQQGYLQTALGSPVYRQNNLAVVYSEALVNPVYRVPQLAVVYSRAQSDIIYGTTNSDVVEGQARSDDVFDHSVT